MPCSGPLRKRQILDLQPLWSCSFHKEVMKNIWVCYESGHCANSMNVDLECSGWKGHAIRNKVRKTTLPSELKQKTIYQFRMWYSCTLCLLTLQERTRQFLGENCSLFPSPGGLYKLFMVVLGILPRPSSENYPKRRLQAEENPPERDTALNNLR